jgi:mono/diheme cytochrome c family protein
MNFIKHLVITLLILFVIACLAYWAIALSGRMNVAADGSHWPVTDRVLDSVRENSVARHARGIEPRLPELSDEMEVFEAVIGFEDMCATCHTPPGGSPTAMSRGLNPPAPDLAKLAGHRTPAELFWVTKHGIRMSGMPAWGPTHSDAELWPLVALITRFPEFADNDYGNLLTAAREAGVEHVHDHGHEHDHGHDHHEDGHQHDHDRDGDQDHEHDDNHHPHHLDHDDEENSADHQHNGDDHDH